MFPWGDTPSAYVEGSAVYSGGTRGTVVSVDAKQATMGVVWSDGDGGAIVYPMDATYLRKGLPWEI